MRPNRQILLEIVVQRDAVIRVLEEFDVLLQVFQVELLLGFVEECSVSLVRLEPPGFLLQREYGILGRVRSRVEFCDLARVQVEVTLVLLLSILQFLAVFG